MIEWKEIPGIEGYEVSNTGEVRSLTRYVEYCDGRVCRKKGRILKPRFKHNGYLVVEIKKKQMRVHRLVWEAFKGEIPTGMEVNHINEDKSDNRLENLNLLSHKENSNWGTRNKRIGRSLVGRKLSEEQKEKLRIIQGEAGLRRSKKVLQYSREGELICIWPSLKIVGENGFSQECVGKCCRGYRKTHRGFIWTYMG